MKLACSYASQRKLLGLSEAIADAVERFDHFKIGIDQLELFTQSLDVTVNRAVVNIYLIVIGGVHERVSAFHHAGTLGQCMQDQKLCNGQHHWIAAPSACVTFWVHGQRATLQNLGF